MFTPEFIHEDIGEFILVSNHCLASAEAVSFSIEFNRTRIAYGKSHLPAHIHTCRLIYDIRGQNVPPDVIEKITLALESDAFVEFKR
ncbi:hypothetical protein ABRQ00_12950 [Pectobacterium aroidearum]|uniref:hypothetical protein n=1 Tax=Pectobacterium aroidearum TaxID=1201031 RepID=UPI001CD6928D|nr:hypothetical protein [Pectobacterium aroidearum]